MSLAIRYVPRDTAQGIVAKWHSHHDPHHSDIIRLGAFVGGGGGGECVGVSVLGRPVAPALNAVALEVTRLCIGPNAPAFMASRLLGRTRKLAYALGCERLVSYTRVDEPGTCYLAAGWWPVKWTRGERHDHGNRRHKPRKGSTEVTDRIRWETGPAAQPRNPQLVWRDGMWRRIAKSAGPTSGPKRTQAPSESQRDDGLKVE